MKGQVKAVQRPRGNASGDTPADDPVGAIAKCAVRAAWHPAAVIGAIILTVKRQNTVAAQ